MFHAYIYEYCSAAYEKNILLIDEDGLEEKTEYGSYFAARGFSVVRYENDLAYRLKIEDRVKIGVEKFLLIAGPKVYIPYDVQKRFHTVQIGIAQLFPKLNPLAVREDANLNYDLLTLACRGNFDDLTGYQAARAFLQNTVRGSENAKLYVEELCRQYKAEAAGAKNYRDWFRAARKKAAIHVLAQRHGIRVRPEEGSRPFVDYVIENFGKLSSEMAADTPVLVSRAMEYIRDHSEKFVVIVMDGMSEFDWNILSESFDGIRYEKSHAMAMIPTVTSVSRQCLLGGKFPRELENPWSQSRERQEFMDCGRRLGYEEVQIGYGRGYDVEFGPAVLCAAVIINDIDQMVHGQRQGRPGMYHNMTLLAKEGRLADTVKRMLRNGFDVYLTADHGNTPCTGVGRLVRTGVEIETKSRRMAVLRNFADKKSLMEKYPNLIEYPGYYLDRQFTYLLWGIGESFDSKGEETMNHGGITVDEVIVPFIKIKAVENNG